MATKYDLTGPAPGTTSAQPSVQITVNGATVKNNGPDTIYYAAGRASAPTTNTAGTQVVNAGTYDGTLASGASATLDGNQWFAVAAGARAELVCGPVPSVGNGGASYGIGAPSSLIVGDTYFQQDGGGSVVAEWIGTDSGPQQVADLSSTAGGDLSGTYPAPAIKAALKDGLYNVAAMRTLGPGTAQAAPGPLANRYRTLLSAAANFPAGAGSGTRLLGVNSSATSGSTSATTPIPLLNLLAADIPVISGLTSKLRVRAVVAVNATAPAINFTFALVPVTVAGAAGGVVYTAGATVGNTAVATAPAASTPTPVVAADFDLPADGIYGLALTLSGTVATSSYVIVNASVELRYV